MNALNAIEILKQGIRFELHKTIIEDIVKDELAEYEAKIRPMIEAKVAEMTLQHIESMHDFLELRDELHVHVHWDDDQGKKI